MSTRWHAQDCYKDIITDICNWSSTFNGFDAKWIDQCSESLEVNIPVLSKTYYEEVTDNVEAGTVDPNSRKYCKNLPLISQDNPNVTGSSFSEKFMDRAYPMLFKWIEKAYK